MPLKCILIGASPGGKQVFSPIKKMGCEQTTNKQKCSPAKTF